MNNWDSLILDTLYDGTASEKLAWAHLLHKKYFQHSASIPGLQEELEQLRREAGLLAGHMCHMNLPELCGRCASGKGGGCCSAYMAGNTDSPQILINLMLDIEVTPQSTSTDICCFLGKRGCLFLIKPIFCLNYNCTAIVQTEDKPQLAQLYRRMGDVLSRQTVIESILLQSLRHQHANLPELMTSATL